MATENIVDHVRGALQPLADPEQARRMSDYLRGQFPFLGIPTPQRRAAIGKIGADLDQPTLLDAAERLWDLPQREYKYAAADMLAGAARRLDADALAPLIALAQREPWWDTVDALAGVVGTIVRRQRAADPRAVQAMDDALLHPSLWVRRIAMLHQRGWRLETDEARLFRYALALANEEDFFLRKAIGWALRDYARWNPPAFAAFLAEHRGRFAPLTVREASRHMEAED
ncbi:3-methyladenine DNA glycosylase AlkD [Pseudoduganella flava]|uniref:3-methyladenine DNA glycosylase AlkD n=1 Tax=Pseudoduganella flava TaxID=871742 RepID=A0A562PLQ6_9BURK|nr:DNA alkylation repair protein [Pseudoduganella flava]QGZ42412.1 DNA alkylation repair protein [Pseudoduganella flava]TWI44976.1 3-methyladenine DNA glycosylase AlkD [Pseudoduganella flava]